MANQELKRAYSQAFLHSDPFVNSDPAIQKIQKAYTVTPQTMYGPLSLPDSNKENRPPPYCSFDATVEINYPSQHSIYRQQGLPSITDHSHSFIPSNKLPFSNAIDGFPMIHEDPNVSISDPLILADNPVAIDLRFQALSLLDESTRTASVLPYQRMSHHHHHHRTSLSVLHKAFFATCFAHIRRNEILVGFHKGKQVIKVDKYMLCSESRFFSIMLDGPFLPDSLAHYMRLRDDFPYGVKAMLQFVEMGAYYFDDHMLIEYPLVTVFDLHVHAYVVGNKYEVPRLCDYAISQYTYLSQQALSQSNTMDMDCFLDSLVLLWKNTYDRQDALRNAVLELIKPKLNHLMKVEFFTTLMTEMVSFGDDVLHSLEQDGFDVTVIQAPGGLQGNHGSRLVLA